MADAEKKGLRLFYSYTHEDERWRKKLETHLSTLQKQGIITSWDRRQVLAGTEHHQEITQHLQEADLILLLVSPDFIAAEYCYGVEMMQALERHQSGDARVIPIMVRPTDCQGTPFAHLQALPTNNKPISRWRDPDEALMDIVRSMRDVIEQWVPSLAEQTTSSSMFSTQSYMRARTKYLEHVYRLYNSVRLPLGPAEGFALQAVFQPLRLRQNPLAAEDLKQAQRRKLLGEGPQEQETADIGQWPAETIVDTSEEALKKSAQKRIIILGGPGTGKTTTLKHLAGVAARDALIDTHAPLPIFFSLADLARSGKSLPHYLRDQVEDLGIEQRYADLLWKAKEEGSAFLCLDSLDEVSPELRAKMIELIHIWVAEKGNIWVIGSRFTEYKGGQFKQGQFLEWELLPMNRALCMDLALRLFSELQRLLHAPGPTEPSPTAFVSALEQHPQAAAWGENPLLFSLAAVVFFQTGGLPATRAMLYREIVEAVLAMREPDQLRRKQLLRVLAALALWLHQKKGRVYTFEDLRMFLEEIQQRSWGETTQIAHQIIASGIMEVLARDTYGFRHQTFQEYLAATELARCLTAHQKNTREEAWALAWSKRTYSRWTEVLRLMVGSLVQLPGKMGVQEAQHWIHGLLNQQATAEGDPGLLGFTLALKSLVELVGSSAEHTPQMIQLEAEIADTWINQLLNSAQSLRNVRLSGLQRLTEEIGSLHEWTLENALAKLRDALEHVYGGVRRCAVLALAILEKNITSDTLLRAALYDVDISVRRAAARALGKLDEQAPLEPLLVALQGGKSSVRRAAAEALGELGERAPLEPLLVALHDSDRYVRRAAAEALGKLGERVPAEPLFAALQDRESQIDNAAVRSFEGRVSSAKLLEMLSLEHRSTYYMSLQVLMQKKNQGVLSSFLAFLQDSDTEVRKATAEALGRCGEWVSAAPLLAALQDRDQEIRQATVKALGASEALVPLGPLLVALQDSESSVRQAVAQAVGKLGERVPLEPLLIALHDDSSSVRWAAAQALGELGERVPLELLLAALHDSKNFVRGAAAEALGKLGKRAPLEPLLVALHDSDRYVRGAAAQALGKLGERVPLEPLFAALQDGESFVREAAAQALGKLGERVPLEPLLVALHDSDSSMHQAAVQALGKLGERVPLEPLLVALHDSDSFVRLAAAQALGELGERVPLEPLFAALQDGESFVRRAAAEALGKLGERVPLEPLLVALHDSDRYVRKVATEALRKLGERVPTTYFASLLGDEYIQVRMAALGAFKTRASDEIFDEVIAEAAAIVQHRPSGKYLGSLTQGWIAEMIGYLGDASPQVFEKLIPLLDWPYWQVRVKAAQALGNIRRNIPDEALRRLLELRHDPVQAVVQAADEALVQILSLETGIEDDEVS